MKIIIFLFLEFFLCQIPNAGAVLQSKGSSSSELVPAYDHSVADVSTDTSSSSQGVVSTEANDPYTFGYKKALPSSVAVKPNTVSPVVQTVSGPTPTPTATATAIVPGSDIYHTLTTSNGLPTTGGIYHTMQPTPTGSPTNNANNGITKTSYTLDEIEAQK